MEVKVVCPCGQRIEKRLCYEVQKLPGYDETKPIQIVLECNENCCKNNVEQKEEISVSPSSSSFSYSWIIISCIIIFIAILLDIIISRVSIVS